MTSLLHELQSLGLVRENDSAAATDQPLTLGCGDSYIYTFPDGYADSGPTQVRSGTVARDAYMERD